MPDMFADVITKREMIAEIEREIAMRRTVYGRRIADRKMNPAIAERQIAVMERVLAVVRDAP
jgi:hypothetical protein